MAGRPKFVYGRLQFLSYFCLYILEFRMIVLPEWHNLFLKTHATP